MIPACRPLAARAAAPAELLDLTVAPPLALDSASYATTPLAERSAWYRFRSSGTRRRDRRVAGAAGMEIDDLDDYDDGEDDDEDDGKTNNHRSLGRPQHVRLRVRDVPSFSYNHSLVVNAPRLDISRITPEHVVRCRQSLLVTAVYSELLIPRYSPIPAPHRHLHDAVYDGRRQDKDITLSDFAQLFDRKVHDASGELCDAFSLDDFCRIMHRINSSKPGVMEAYWSYFMVFAVHYWLSSNCRFMYYDPKDRSTFSLAYPQYIFAICPFTDFRFNSRRVSAATLPPTTLLWKLARQLTIPEFAMWLCTRVCEFCTANGYDSLVKNSSELKHMIVNKLHRNNELFLTSRRFSRIPYANMGAYIHNLNDAIREQCDQLKTDAASHTFGCETKHWYPQQVQHRRFITKPNNTEFAGAAVYMFAHPQFAPHLPILPRINTSDELGLRALCWWLQWWCPKSDANTMDPSFNHFVEQMYTTDDAAVTRDDDATATATAAVDAYQPEQTQRELHNNSDGDTAESVVAHDSSARATEAKTDARRSTTTLPSRRRASKRLASAYIHKLPGWRFVDYTRVQYSAVHGGGRFEIAYMIDRGKRNPAMIQELTRHEMSPVFLSVDALMSIVIDHPSAPQLIRTAREWFDVNPADFRLQPILQPDVQAPTGAAASASAATSSTSTSTSTSSTNQRLLTDMLVALDGGASASTADAPGPGTTQRSKSKSIAFPFDALMLGNKHPSLYTWRLHDAWLDKPASTYEVFMAFALFYRVAKHPETRWFNLWQVMALISGDEAVAYRYTLSTWCATLDRGTGRKRPYPSATRSAVDNRKTCREFLLELRRQYLEEVDEVHKCYTALLERRRDVVDRGCKPDLPQVDTYTQAEQLMDVVMNEQRVSGVKKPRLLSAISYNDIIRPYELEHENAALRTALARIPGDVATHRWKRLFHTWKSVGAAHVLVDTGDMKLELQPVKSFVLESLVRMWMATWYYALSVQSLRTSPCLVPFDHLESEGAVDARKFFEQRNQCTGWDRFIPQSPESIAAQKAVGQGTLMAGVLPDLTNAVHLSATTPTADTPLWRGVRHAVERYLLSRAAKRALASYVQQPIPVDARTALLLQLVARTLYPTGDTDGVRRLSTDSAEHSNASGVLWGQYHDFVHSLFLHSIPLSPTVDDPPLANAVQFVYTCLRRRLIHHTCIFASDWVHADDVITRAIHLTHAGDDVPSSSIIIGRILQRIIQDVPDAKIRVPAVRSSAAASSASSAATAVPVVPGIDADNDNCVLITTAILKTRLAHSRNHKIAEDVFNIFPHLVR